MSKKLIGCFYLRKTKSGNILSEFTNNLDAKIITESADINESDDINKFPGKYFTTWQEEKAAILMSLTIKQNILISKKFQLEWSKDGEIVFLGEGFLLENDLIGYYELK